VSSSFVLAAAATCVSSVLTDEEVPADSADYTADTGVVGAVLSKANPRMRSHLSRMKSGMTAPRFEAPATAAMIRFLCATTNPVLSLGRSFNPEASDSLKPGTPAVATHLVTRTGTRTHPGTTAGTTTLYPTL